MPPPSLLIRPPPSGARGMAAPKLSDSYGAVCTIYAAGGSSPARGLGGDGGPGAGRSAIAPGAEHLDEQPCDAGAPGLAVELGRPEPALGDGVLRPCEPVEGGDHVDHPVIALRAGDARDPDTGAAVVGEDALLDALPVGVLEQAARVALLRPATGDELVVAALDAAQGELEEPPAAVVLRQPLQRLSHRHVVHPATSWSGEHCVGHEAAHHPVWRIHDLGDLQITRKRAQHVSVLT